MSTTTGSRRGPAPAPHLATGLDDIARSLRELRSWGANPSFTVLVRQVAAVRRARGVPEAEATPGRVTVYDCFRDGRSRIDIDLVVDIVAALGVGRAEQVLWRQSVRAVMSPSAGIAIAPVRDRPRSPDGFVGRVAELAEVAAACADRPAAVVVEGMPGIGKSTLALQAAHELVRVDRSRHLLQVDLRGFTADVPSVPSAAVADAVLRLVSARGGAPADVESRWREYRALLRERAVVLVLDDAATAEQVLPLLAPPGSPSTVLITSRTHLELGPTARAVVLAEMDRQDARQLLGVHSAGEEPEQQAADDLCAAVGHLPLALNLLSRQIAARPGWTLQDHVVAHRNRTELLQLDESVVAAVTMSWEALHVADQEVLISLSSHPGHDADLDAIVVMTGPQAGAHQVLKSLQRLTDAHLARCATPGRWQVHDAIRTFVRRQALTLRPPSQLENAMARLLEHYLTLAVAAVGALIPMAYGDWPWVDRQSIRRMDEEHARDVLAAERANLLGCAAWAADHGQHSFATRVAAVLAHHLWQRGETDGTVAVHRAARRSAVELGDVEAEALAERNLGSTFVRVGRFAQAEPRLERALALYRELDHQAGQISTLNAIGYLASSTGDQERSVRIFTELLERLGGPHVAGERWAVTTANLAVALQRTARPQESVALLREVAEVSGKQGWRGREQWACSNLAQVLVEVGEPAAALPVARRALELSSAADDQVGMGYALVSLAAAQIGVGEHADAEQSVTDARARSAGLDAPDLEAAVLSSLGDVRRATGQRAEAEAAYREALGVATAVGEAAEIERATAGLAALGPD